MSYLNSISAPTSYYESQELQSDSSHRENASQSDTGGLKSIPDAYLKCKTQYQPLQAIWKAKYYNRIPHTKKNASESDTGSLKSIFDAYPNAKIQYQPLQTIWKAKRYNPDNLDSENALESVLGRLKLISDASVKGKGKNALEMTTAH